MRPFRDPPRLELGPLSVGLADAAGRAMAFFPRGGRIRGGRPGAITPRVMGAFGSGGLFVVVTVAFVAMTSGWLPASWADRGAVVAVTLVGGMSLAMLLRAMDRVAATRVLPGDVVGRAARRVVARMARLAARAERSPLDFGARRVAALRRAIAAARDPDVAAWIPVDLVGRAELLLARAIAARAVDRWTDDPARRADVRDLLVRAADHLADATPALADLAVLDEASGCGGATVGRAPLELSARRRSRPVARRLRVASCAGDDDDALAREELAEMESATVARRIRASGS